jgi:hypothetical protein
MNMCLQFPIIYADDTVILSESKDGLQKTLDIFESYCEIWKLLPH